jgi:hypothetical protein
MVSVLQLSRNHTSHPACCHYFFFALAFGFCLDLSRNILGNVLAIMKGTPDLPVVRAILLRSNFSFLPLDLLMLTATGRFLFFVRFLAETLRAEFVSAFFGVRFWPALFSLPCTAMACKC